jgi:hypothetical protein
VNDVDGKADIWTMSPPCQPCKHHTFLFFCVLFLSRFLPSRIIVTTTRGANRKDHLDHRSKGLYHIMSLLLQMKYVLSVSSLSLR